MTDPLNILRMGATAHGKGDLDTAARRYEEVLQIDPKQADALHLLGMVFHAKENYERAAELIQEAVNIQPKYPAYLLNLGVVLRELGRLDDAIAVNKRAMSLDSKNPHVPFNLGRAYQEKRDWKAAINAYQRALALDPDMAQAHNNIGWALKEQGLLGEAHQSLTKALALQPKSAGTRGNLGGVYKDMGKLDDAIANYRKALSLKASMAGVGSNLLLTLNYHAEYSGAFIAREHRTWAARHANTLPPLTRAAAAASTPDRPLRIGYVSPDFRVHSVGFFIEPIVKAHDASRVTSVLYADGIRRDAVSERLKGAAGEWRDLYGWSDEKVAQQVVDDRIDILVDLAGHTAGNRLLAFARRPAPIQITYLGYPNTTGMDAMDYRLTDAWADPPNEADDLHTETLLRLPHGFLCYQPPPSTPPPSAVPQTTQGHVTFGSFNNLTKITPEVVAVWCSVLHATPGSRMILKSRPLADADVMRAYRDLFESHDIAPDRLELVGHTASINDHLALYSRIDVGLDPFPYNGTTTTCEALWMGVPVITLAGDRHAGRVGVSIGNNVGLTELIADSIPDYIERATALAADMDRLAGLRSSLRERMKDSFLLSPQQFTAALEDMYFKAFADHR